MQDKIPVTPREQSALFLSVALCFPPLILSHIYQQYQLKREEHSKGKNTNGRRPQKDAARFAKGDIMDDVKKIGDYSVKYSMYIGHKDIALGENPDADKDERYMCCFVENNAIFERYSEVLVSDDFAEIAKVFGQRVADAAEEIIRENERVGKELGTNEEITAEDCNPISSEDSIENKVVVIKGNILRPEFRYANHQLMLCTGGFGAQANARGRTCYCVSLYDGRRTSFYRSDILGVIELGKLPEWAQKGLEKTKEIHAQEKKPVKERSEAR